MRTNHSIRNIMTSTFSNIVAILFGFISQKIFIQVLGLEYLGINGLFSNIISMLGIVELGLSSAIIYHLYQPIANKDTKRIKTLMNFYQTGYRAIAGIILLLSLLIYPFLSFIVGPINIAVNISIVFFLFVLDIVFSYLLTYKRSIIYASQKNYIVYIVHTIYLVIMNSIQITILLYTKNYYLYLGIKIIMRILENIALTICANKLYPVLKEKDIDPLESDTKKDIFTKMKGLFYHKIGSFVVMGTDNILISIFLGISTVGLYSNYNMIISAIHNLLSQVFSSITSSVGNLVVAAKETKVLEVFNNIHFASRWIACFVSSSFCLIVTSFINIWLGTAYELSFPIVLVLSINIYFLLTQFNMSTFKEAAGIFHEDRYIPIIQAITNIIVSVILVKWIGLAGIFVGTIVSSFILHFYSYPKYIYKKLFHKDYKEYLKDVIPYYILYFVIMVISCCVIKFTPEFTPWLNFGFKVALSILIPNIIMYLCFRKREEFIYYKELLKKISN